MSPNRNTKELCEPATEVNGAALLDELVIQYGVTAGIMHRAVESARVAIPYIR